MQLLLQHGADVSNCVKNGTLPLCIASVNGHKDVVQLLLQCSSDVHVLKCDNDGVSPLYAASQDGHTNGVHIL